MVDDYKCIVSDINKNLTMLWNEIKKDTFKYPQFVSKKTWLKYKNDPTPSAMKAFVGFGCSFGGEWFSTYSGDYSKIRDPILEAISSIKKKEKYIKKIYKIVNKSYERWDPKNFLIYCDPPYHNTKQYKIRPNFDHTIFWDIVRKWSKNNIVIVSEYKAPRDFKCIWKKKRKKTINLGRNIVEEKLFIIRK